MSWSVKNPPAVREIWVRSLGWEDPLEEGMATHSSVLAWRVPPGSMGPQSAGPDQAFMHGIQKPLLLMN